MTRGMRKFEMRKFGASEEVDFAIIGSGAAGGVLARELSTAGFRVVVDVYKRQPRHTQEHEVTCVKGKRFPPCRDCAHPRFVLQRKAHHIETHEFFSHYY